MYAKEITVFKQKISDTVGEIREIVFYGSLGSWGQMCTDSHPEDFDYFLTITAKPKPKKDKHSMPGGVGI